MLTCECDRTESILIEPDYKIMIQKACTEAVKSVKKMDTTYDLAII